MAAGSITEQCALLLPALSAAASGEGEGWRKVEAVDEALVQLRKVPIIFRAGVGCAVQLGRTLPTLSPKVVARLHSASKLLVLRREEAPPNAASPGSTTAVEAGDDPEDEGEGGARLPTPRASSRLLTDWSEAASRPGTTSGETASIARHRRSTAVNESHSFRGAAVVSRSSQPSATCSMSTPSGSRRHRSTISPAINTDSRGHSSHPAAQIGSARPGACTQPEAEERVTLPSAAGGLRRRAAMRNDPPSRMRRSLSAPRCQHEWRGARVDRTRAQSALSHFVVSVCSTPVTSKQPYFPSRISKQPFLSMCGSGV